MDPFKDSIKNFAAKRKSEKKSRPGSTKASRTQPNPSSINLEDPRLSDGAGLAGAQIDPLETDLMRVRDTEANAEMQLLKMRDLVRQLRTNRHKIGKWLANGELKKQGKDIEGEYLVGWKEGRDWNVPVANVISFLRRRAPNI